MSLLSLSQNLPKEKKSSYNKILLGHSLYKICTFDKKKKAKNDEFSVNLCYKLYFMMMWPHFFKRFSRADDLKCFLFGFLLCYGEMHISMNYNNRTNKTRNIFVLKKNKPINLSSAFKINRNGFRKFCCEIFESHG